MLLVDGKPTPDLHSDGLAVPECVEEQRFHLLTARGPRIFLPFGQTK